MTMYNIPAAALLGAGIMVALILGSGGAVLEGQEAQDTADSGWRITVERVQTIFQSEKETNFPGAELLPNGDIPLAFSIGEHGVTERGKALISHDRGLTWEEPEPEKPVVCYSVCVLADGTVISLVESGWEEGWEEVPAHHLGDETSEPKYSLRWSEDGGTTWQQKIVPIKLPEGVKFYGPSNLVELPDGSLLGAYYGNRPGQAKYHSGLIRSTDRGETWEYYGEIAYASEHPMTGYCEPAMIRLANGDLLCMLRTGSPSPMCQTRSTDGGKTWSEPQQVMDHGVAPDLYLMQNGVLVCSYGRPNAGIMFSYDGTGHKWEDAQDLYRGQGSHYTCMLELEPGLLMYFYDQSAFVLYDTSPGPLNEIRVAYIRVERAEVAD